MRVHHFLAILLLVLATGAHAVPRLVTFSVTGFATAPVPDPLVGNVTVDLDPVTGQVLSISRINLTINGHVYSVAEVGPLSVGGLTGVGGTVNGTNSAVANTDDFFVAWDAATQTFSSFAYTSVGLIAAPVALGPNTLAVAALPAVSSAVPTLSPWALALLALLFAGAVAVAGRRGMLRTR